MRRTICATTAGLGAAVAVVGMVLVSRTLSARPQQAAPEPPLRLAVDAGEAATRLAGGIRFRTVSHGEAAREPGGAGQEAEESLLGLHRYLQETYPRVHRTLRREVISRFSLLYRWAGSDPDAHPLLLMAHFDVVPVESASKWEYSPFSGRIAGGYVWGRGALDDKGSVFALLEAAEHLLARGFRPRRTIYLAFGHDEEIGGNAGAQQIAQAFEERGVRPAMVLDEGGAVVSGMLPGVSFPVAAVGVAEKGYVSVELTVEGKGGHSSAPPPHTAVGILAGAIRQLEGNQLPARLRGPMRDLIATVGPSMPFGSRLVCTNLWLFAPVIERLLVSLPQGNAALRTTTAATIFHSGVKDNVLPKKARAVVNFRIHPSDSVTKVLEHVRQTVNDPRVHIRPLPEQHEPSATSPTDSPEYALLAHTIRQIYPAAVVAPNLIPGATDSRYFRQLAANVYGFMPVRLHVDDLERIHGRNERVSVAGFGESVRFYAQLMWNASGGTE